MVWREENTGLTDLDRPPSQHPMSQKCPRPGAPLLGLALTITGIVPVVLPAPHFFRETGTMAPDIYTFEPDSAVHSIHRDRIGELRERLIRLQQESDRITRSFVRLHGLRTAIATPGADLVERVEQVIAGHEADIIRTHALLHDASIMLDDAETLWARQAMQHIPTAS
jgi:hypothetical protein